MKASAATVRWVRPAAAVGFWRAVAMALSLAALLLTFHVLSFADFAAFNLIIFMVALGSAVAAPLNRAFWADDTVKSFNVAVLATAAVGTTVLWLGLTVSALAGSVVLTIPVIAAAGGYGITRTIERFGYGRLLADGQSSGAVVPIVIFAVADLLVALGMWFAEYENLLARMVLPPVVFLLLLGWSSYRFLLSELAPTAEQIRRSTAFARTHLASPTGVKVIGLGILATSAAAGDRFLAAYFPLDSERFDAAYLLTVSYAIALQTLTAFLFDMARVRVFQDGAWKRGAGPFISLCVTALTCLALLVIAVHPLLIRLNLLPSEITIVLWAGLLARSEAVSLSYLLNVDRFQEGRLGPIAAANIAICVGGTSAFLLLGGGASQQLVGTILIATSLGTTAVLAWRFARRIPR